MFGPKSAMLTLYGDYVRHKGGEIGIGSLITLLGNFGLSEQSIRSAVSRMCRMGLLVPRRDGAKSYYSLSDDGFSLINKGAQRIFERKTGAWGGTWSTVVYYIPEERRQARDRLRQELTWMGYGPLTTATWVSPHNMNKEVLELSEKLKVRDYIQVFHSRNECCSSAKDIISRCWDLGRIHQKYTEFLGEFEPKLSTHKNRVSAGENIGPSQCFVERFKLIDEYRRLPFFDPELPIELLPENWLRPRATALFDEYHDSLTDKANEYFDSVYDSYLRNAK